MTVSFKPATLDLEGRTDANRKAEMRLGVSAEAGQKEEGDMAMPSMQGDAAPEKAASVPVRNDRPRTATLDLEQFKGHSEGPWIVKTAGVLMWVEGPTHTICYVSDGISRSENSAVDAPLIAAAPTLLARLKDAEEALEKILHTSWGAGPNTKLRDVFEIARSHLQPDSTGDSHEQ